MNTVALRHRVACVVEPSFDRLPTVQLEHVGSGTAALISELQTEESHQNNRFRVGDVLFSKLRPYLAKTLLVRTAMHGSSEFLCLRPGPEIDSTYLQYLTLSRGWLDHAVLTSYGTKMPRTSWEELSAYRIPKLELDEQRRIADFLDDRVARIDQIITARRRQIDSTREAIFSALGAMLRGSGPERRLAWSLQLGAVGVVVNPSSYFSDDGVPFLHGYNVREGYFDLSDLKRMSDADSMALGRSRIRRGDVLVVRAGYPGRAAVVTCELDGGNCASVLLLRPNAGVDPHWLAALFNSPVGKKQIEAVQYGAAQGVINLADVVSFEIPLPNLDEQRRRLARHRDLEGELRSASTLIASQVGLLAEYKQSLITAAVTGEFDVTTASGSIP